MKKTNPRIQIIFDQTYRFLTGFDAASGAYLRTGILDARGKDTGVDPFMASFPHLIDVGIMGHCIHGGTGLCREAGVQCYQSGFLIRQPNMKVEDFAALAAQCKGRVNQFALGGRGDPNKHEHFEQILALCRENGIVPNYTTSGFGLTDGEIRLTKAYCGAVAVSWYRSAYTHTAIQRFLAAGVKTNIHYVLSRHTIAEAVDLLRADNFPKGINAVIFLLHKPVGQGGLDGVLDVHDPHLPGLVRLVEQGRFSYKVGFDSCSLPLILNRAANIDLRSMDTCEGGRFSCYITSDMHMTPCSFDQSKEYAVSLRASSIQKAWEGEAFARFRQRMQENCPDCSARAGCLGGCPLIPQIVLCARMERSYPMQNQPGQEERR